MARITSKHPNKEPWHENIRSNGQRQGKKEDCNSSYANYRAKISLPFYFFLFLFLAPHVCQFADEVAVTVIDRKLIIFNNNDTNSRFNHGATDADATDAIVVIFAFTVAVLRTVYSRTSKLKPVPRPTKN